MAVAEGELTGGTPDPSPIPSALVSIPGCTATRIGDPNPCANGTTGVATYTYNLVVAPGAPVVVAYTSASFLGMGTLSNATGTYASPSGLRTAMRWCPCSGATENDPMLREACRISATARCEVNYSGIDTAPSSTWGWRHPSVNFPFTSAYGRCNATFGSNPECTSIYNTRVALVGERPVEVLAATLDPLNGEAIVLDRLATTQGQRVRFLRIDLTTGRSREIATYPTSQLYDTYSLAAAPDGGLVVSASRAKGTIEYRLVRFTLPRQRGQAVSVNRRWIATGKSLAAPIVVDQVGVSVVVAGARFMPEGVRWPQLTSASTGDLAALF